MSRSQVVMPRSIVAWHQSQADVRAGNGAVIQRHDAYVNNVQRFGAVIKIFQMRDRTKVRCDDEIAGAKRPRDEFDRVAGFQRRAQQLDPNVGVQSHETVVELTYRLALLKSALYFQPDLQYVFRPGGTGRISDALVLGAQVGVNF